MRAPLRVPSTLHSKFFGTASKSCASLTEVLQKLASSRSQRQLSAPESASTRPRLSPEESTLSQARLPPGLWRATLQRLLEPLTSSSSNDYHLGDWRSKRGDESMASSIEIVVTPTADTPGTALVLRTATKHYIFGNLAEGTQRAMVQQGTRLLKAQDFFLTGRAEWKNVGGLVGMMLTLADSTTSSYATSMELHKQALSRGRTSQAPPKPHFNIYGPPNVKHTLGTCRRFIFRKGIPIVATEYKDESPEKDEHGAIPPTWQDKNIQVWALSVKPAGLEQDAKAEAELEARKQHFDTTLNTFEDHQAPESESPEDREVRYDRIRTATVKYMFDSNWSFDTLVERHISEVKMPAAIFIRNPDTHKYMAYTGPMPGGRQPLPDITVWTRTPWPGASILALPPTKPTPECISYIIRTYPCRGVFDVARAKALGVKPGPNFGKLTNGQSVENENGEWITPDQVLGADRPGQGVAILDVPSVKYLEKIVLREEFTSPDVMAGIQAIIWMLGPGVSGHATLLNFMKKLDNVQHVISSIDTSPNRITHDSVAGQATRLGQIDPTRYSTPVHDNDTIPQESLHSYRLVGLSPLPKSVIAADRGMSFTLMPKFAAKIESASTIFVPEVVRKETAPEVLELAGKAQRALKDDQKALESWKTLLARPDTEVITLGTGSALPSKYRNVSATLVRVPGVGNYLFDCGESTLGQLSRVFPFAELVQIIKDLRVIWISHLHADHHLGTASMIKAWYQLAHNSIPNPQQLGGSVFNIDANSLGLSVISHSGMLQWLHEYSAVEDFGYSRILPLQILRNDGTRDSKLMVLNSFGVNEMHNAHIHKDQYQELFGFSDIQAVKVAHCYGAMAVSVTFPPSAADAQGVQPLKVSYSGDCRPSANFARIGKDTTILIHEATFDDELEGDAKAKKHSTTSEALGIGAKMDAKAVVLTHFSQRYQKIPVLQTVTDGEPDDEMLELEEVVEEANDTEEGIVDSTIQNVDNMDIHPTIAPSSSTSAPAKITPALQPSTSSLGDNERVIKIRNKDMKVAIAFDYMRVKIGEIAELEKFNEALNELLTKEKDEEGDTDGTVTINANGKKMSEDEKGESKKKQKKGKSKRNN